MSVRPTKYLGSFELGAMVKNIAEYWERENAASVKWW
jgi:hypothetical protein